MPLISIVGDSISTYAGYNPSNCAVYYDEAKQQANGLMSVRDTWWYQVINRLGGQLCVNQSYSGSRVSGEVFPSASCEERLSQLHTNQAMPDTILLYIGFNDFGNGVKIHKDDRPKQISDCFEDSYAAMLEKIQQFYPAATVICGTLLQTYVKDRDTWQFPEACAGIHIDRYNDTIRNLVDEKNRKNIMLADLAATGVRYETLDGAHPTVNGHRTIAEAWVSCLEKS